MGADGGVSKHFVVGRLGTLMKPTMAQ
jgi:hypothetical protein